VNLVINIAIRNPQQLGSSERISWAHETFAYQSTPFSNKPDSMLMCRCEAMIPKKVKKDGFRSQKRKL